MSLGKSEGSDPRRAPTLRNLIGGRRRSFPGQNVAKIWPSTHPKCGDLHFKMLKMQETIWKCKTLWKELQLIPWQPQRLEISELWKSMTIEPFKCPPISSYKLVDRFPKKSMGYHCILIPPQKKNGITNPDIYQSTNQPRNFWWLNWHSPKLPSPYLQALSKPLGHPGSRDLGPKGLVHADIFWGITC